MTSIWIGCYPAAGLGSQPGLGEGLWRAVVAEDGALSAEQATVQPAPSFALIHPRLPVVIAVEETDPTTVSFRDAHTGVEGARVPVGGSYGCHLLLAQDARTLYVSNYGSGDLAVIMLEDSGLPAAGAPHQFLTHTGSGPRGDRQEASHAHSAQLSPDGRYVLVADLGTDQLRRYAIGPGGLLGDAGIAATLDPGAGPRHFVVREDLLYVVCELDHQLRVLRWDRASATAQLVAAHPTTLATHRTGDAVYDAHVVWHRHAWGEVVLVSVRGADVISIFDVAPEGELSYRGAFDAGYWPRHFDVVGDHLVVVAERGHEIRSYALADVVGLSAETETGAVAQLPYKAVHVVSPSCVASAK